jgi:hypothetical protein
MVMQNLRWDVLGVAGIAMKKVIPAMQTDRLTSLEDAVANMTAIDALFRSAETCCWEALL